MDLHKMKRDLLQQVGSGQKITASAYDTAWLARLAVLGEPMSTRALDWLRAHQLPDGSWGASKPQHFHDRVVCTLAAMIALAKQGETQDRIHLRRAQVALERFTRALGSDLSSTVGFEMIVPTLLAEAEALGLARFSTNGYLSNLSRQRKAKLASLPDRTINRHVTLAHSAEMVGDNGTHLFDVKDLQEPNNSVGCSPSATAYFALLSNPNSALKYLRSVVNQDGSVPTLTPFDLYERIWVLWNLTLAGIQKEKEMSNLYQAHLGHLEAAWKPGRGLGFSINYTLGDVDNTAVACTVFARFGRSIDERAILYYEDANYFRCYDLETHASTSANAHVLEALRLIGLGPEHSLNVKILHFLARSSASRIFWTDKWHCSPYYATSHVIIACAGYVDWLVSDAVCWILETQNADGSWGYYLPTAEETAYCLQALITWKRHGHQVSNETIKRGAFWLANHSKPPYPPLWIGKCLYCPELIVRSVIVSAFDAAEVIV